MTERRLAPHPPSDEQRGLEQPIQHRTRRRPAGLPRVAHLTVDLRLADDHRIETRHDAEEMLHRLAVASYVAVAARLGAKALAVQLPHGRCRLVLAFDEIQLGAVARREQHRLTRSDLAAHALQERAHLARRIGEPLANLERCPVMAHADDDHRHGATRSSSVPCSTASQKVSSTAVDERARHDSPSPRARWLRRSAPSSSNAAA